MRRRLAKTISMDETLNDLMNAILMQSKIPSSDTWTKNWHIFTNV